MQAKQREIFLWIIPNLNLHPTAPAIYKRSKVRQSSCDRAQCLQKQVRIAWNVTELMGTFECVGKYGNAYWRRKSSWGPNSKKTYCWNLFLVRRKQLDTLNDSNKLLGWNTRLLHFWNNNFYAPNLHKSWQKCKIQKIFTYLILFK
jgi:hypothetical protein